MVQQNTQQWVTDILSGKSTNMLGEMKTAAAAVTKHHNHQTLKS